jgi:RsiW-degrading membrane proteinase PrsW (M82 family)
MSNPPIILATAALNRYGNLSRYNTRFITPPTEEEEIYPYRRVWVSIALEAGGLFAIAIALYVLTRFVTLPSQLYRPLNLAMALLPVVLWLIFSWWRERSVPQPRHNLLAVAVISGLAANAISVPLIDQVFQPSRWLPLESALNRIIGYAFTVGLVQAVTLYLTMRFTVWPNQMRIRLDGVAYGAASAIGYATVLNLRFVLSTSTLPFVAAMQIFDQIVPLLCSGIIIGYGLAEVAFNRHIFPPLLAATIGLSAFVTGIAIPLVSGFANTSIRPLAPVSTSSPLLGFLFSAGLLFLISNVFSFLFNVAERQEAEIKIEDAESLGVRGRLKFSQPQPN